MGTAESLAAEGTTVLCAMLLEHGFYEVRITCIPVGKNVHLEVTCTETKR